MREAPIATTLECVYEHIEEDDPQPESILVTPGHVTMTMKSIDDLLDWATTIEVNAELAAAGDGASRVAYVAQLLWKQEEDQPAPTVITFEYDWADSEADTTFRVVASSPHTMDQLADLTIDDRIRVTRSEVENLMIKGHAVKAGI